ncbi:hypothetical protein A2276_08705 [candidate division WOR-1 bacterium RIFOXYA12_FULL_43_27]|uniref:Tyr recombinase domain-containing protein n=1 Tax=candidate division WOR-1 bacterium RIFOXYC2_FULL_46_14 TaxID=1802587 RepID=A0A1F4U2W5_UNCSA|nr:MAG: hypothetical protein A2276_08705 [candidate division WOR-1 bacterium RIFOXYA12_FULL_43_27]OGC19731.1 MAG: hypothetical protein A2292_08570 [candidate division WOR-1 bacterium RIFOXYB2_FULL_46_45]OGC30680.1 MAG: hypothetical protein A2232_02895 [candidate division WOR-1 bacterium RIFOXYA2_FULL_46_56]OGC39231.1 MAG: hypothetical protein A2438_07610 [candidate division WOR-1 bacterium RIFOXYC2_FULL_46_14]
MDNQKLLDEFSDYLKANQLAPASIKILWFKIRRFLGFLEKINIDLQNTTPDILNTFLTSVFNEVNHYGQKSGPKFLYYYILALKRFYNLLEDKEMIGHNPASRLRAPKTEATLPKSLLSKEEMVRVMDVPDVNSFRGIKLRAILELFYGCGLRSGELLNLKMTDVDPKGGTLFVHEGKGKKDRQLPLGKSAAGWLERYLKIRTNLAPHLPYLFLAEGERSHLSKEGLWSIIVRIKKKAGITKALHPHTFRHCFATHLLEEGAPLHAISAMLGHSSIESTQIYTQVNISTLKDFHQKYHPRERGNLNGIKH